MFEGLIDIMRQCFNKYQKLNVGNRGLQFSRYACDFNAVHGGLVLQQLKIRYKDGVSLIFQICVEKSTRHLRG